MFHNYRIHSNSYIYREPFPTRSIIFKRGLTFGIHFYYVFNTIQNIILVRWESSSVTLLYPTETYIIETINMTLVLTKIGPEY